MKRYILVVLIVLWGSFSAFSQEINDSTATSRVYAIEKTSLGIGAGFNYGGLFGANILFYPQQNIGLFAGIGYALADVGYNVGAKIRVINKNHFTKVYPFLTGMYGYNTSITVSGKEEYNKLFYGATIGGGIDLKFAPTNKGYFTFALYVPLRGTEVNDYINHLENFHGVVFSQNLLPIAISVGYQFIVGNF